MAGTGTLSPFVKAQYFTNAGVPAAGYQIFTYLAGTSQKTPTYTDVGLTTPNSNSVILDSAGRCVMFLAPGISYKFVFTTPTDTDPPLAPIWTQDNISAIPISADELDITGVAGENLAAGDGVYLSDGSGGQTAGRWYKWDADFTYASTTANALGMMPAALATGVTGSIRIVGRVTGLSALTPGVLYYVSQTAGALTSAPPANARPVAVADTTTSVILSQYLPIPVASATVAGIVSLGAQTLGTGIKTVDGIAVNSTPNYKPGSDAALDAFASGSLRALVDTTQHANSGTGNTVMTSVSLPAGTLATNGATAKFTFGGTLAANANNKTVTFLFGATIVTIMNGGLNGGAWHATIYVIRTGAATQKIVGFTTARPAGVADASAFSTTAAETLANAITVQTKSQSGTASSDILQEVFIPEVLGA